MAHQHANGSSEIEVYYDGMCPLCTREMRMLQRRDSRQLIRFVDITAEDFDVESVGVSMHELMGSIHGRLRDGTLIKGVEVFRHLYAAVGFRRLAEMSRIPGIAGLLDVAYRTFAKNRLRLTGRCAEEACTVGTEPADMREGRR